MQLFGHLRCDQTAALCYTPPRRTARRRAVRRAVCRRTSLLIARLEDRVECVPSCLLGERMADHLDDRRKAVPSDPLLDYYGIMEGITGVIIRGIIKGLPKGLQWRLQRDYQRDY